MDKIYWTTGIILILVVIIISGCVQQQITKTNEGKTFLDSINDVNLEIPYTIDEFVSYASSGGGSQSSTTREIDSNELNEILDEIKNMNVVGSFETGNRNCFYSGGPSTNFFVCFAENKIVSYLKEDGATLIRWNTIGYEFDIKRSTVINSISDLKECNIDSDCTLTSSGVCDPTGKCNIISAACDPGFRTSINAKHFLIWDFVPLVEDQCIIDKGANYEQKEYFEASCVNNICQSNIIK